MVTTTVADYLYCTNRDAFIAWLIATFPDADDSAKYDVPVTAAEIWSKTPVYPLKSNGFDTYGQEMFVRDETRLDFITMIVVHDEVAVQDLYELEYITVNRGATADEMRAAYPDHAAHNNVFPTLSIK